MKLCDWWKKKSTPKSRPAPYDGASERDGTYDRRAGRWGSRKTFDMWAFVLLEVRDEHIPENQTNGEEEGDTRA
jgi:hypothetical protein